MPPLGAIPAAVGDVNFNVGDKFSSFGELEDNVDQYCSVNYVKLQKKRVGKIAAGILNFDTLITDSGQWVRVLQKPQLKARKLVPNVKVDISDCGSTGAQGTPRGGIAGELPATFLPG